MGNRNHCQKPRALHRLILAASLVLAGVSPAAGQSLAVSLSVTPESITLGEGLILMWAGHPPSSSCTMTVGTWSGPIPTSGADWSVPTVAGEITYLVTCTSPSGKATMTASATVIVLPVPPVSSLELAWQDNATNEQGVMIERQTEPEPAYQEIARVGIDVTSYRDDAISRGLRYCYRVRAFNDAGVSAFSNEACAVAP